MPIAGKFVRVFKIAEKFSVCTIKCLILPSFKSRTLFICCRVLSRKKPIETKNIFNTLFILSESKEKRGNDGKKLSKQ